jgi:hypothetical protein
MWGTLRRYVGELRRLWLGIVRYEVPLRKPRPRPTRSLYQILSGKKSIVVIGRAEGISNIMSDSFLSECDFRIALNNVDIDSIDILNGCRIDAQMVQPPPPYAAFTAGQIKRYYMRYLISNKRLVSTKFDRFYRAYGNRSLEIVHFPDDDELALPWTHYSVFAPTQTGSLVKVLFNIESLRDVYFIGVDFFYTGYHRKSHMDDNLGPGSPSISNHEKKGIPLLEYIIEGLDRRNGTNPLIFHFPLYTKPLFEALSCQYVRFFK